jgi:hypothetical protein
MKLSNQAIEAISERPVVLRLALALGFSERWILRVIGKNKKNGPLTTIAAIQIIREETGLLDSEILEASDVKEPQDNRVNL